MSSQGTAYGQFVDQELTAERTRQTNLNARGAAVVTTCSSLVTLLAGVGAFVSAQTGYVVPKAAIIPLAVTLAGFAAASICGILAGRATGHEVATVDTLELMRTDHWVDNEVDALCNVVYLKIRTIASLRTGSDAKARWLLAALILQVVAAIALSVAIGVILASR